LSEAGASLNEVIWTEQALTHLQAIREYIEQFNPKAASQVANALKAAGDSLAHFPRRGRPVPKTAFRELVTAYRYIVRYYVDENKIVILRVRHMAQRPTGP
jgi:toxin ParE1/3/4